MSETLPTPLKRAAWIAVPVLPLYLFGYPRLLIALFGEDSPWTNYLYHYGFGVVFFAVGLALILGEGSCRPARPRDARWLKVLVGGLAGYLVVHAVWIVLAVRMPFLGD